MNRRALARNIFPDYISKTGVVTVNPGLHTADQAPPELKGVIFQPDVFNHSFKKNAFHL